MRQNVRVWCQGQGFVGERSASSVGEGKTIFVGSCRFGLDLQQGMPLFSGIKRVGAESDQGTKSPSSRRSRLSEPL